MKKIILFVAVVLLLIANGCQTLYEACEDTAEDSEERVECQADEREWRMAIDIENYNLCVAAYSNSAKYHMFHNNHAHGPRDRVKHIDITGDLGDNGCRTLLGDAWADY